MPHHAPARLRRWHATAIIALFFLAVAAAAAVGWWYARESPPHQGPIVLISVDGVPAAALTAYGGTRVDAPGIDALAADSVVFERAYAHSPQLLPAHASILSGQLPIEHGVRDDAGFALSQDARTMAELLRSRGFVTGGAVSSFLLRRDAGVAQGFTFFDADVEGADGSEAIERSASATVDIAERWARMQDGQRYFLFVQVPEAGADASVTRLVQLLKERGLYEKATILFVGDRGSTGAAVSLTDAVLHVPLLIKQPGSEGAGRRVAVPVQQIDLLPTILDLVRAPIPGGLRGRSLRAVLDRDDAPLPATPIYAEALAAHFRFGGQPLFAVTVDGTRYIRGATEEVIALDAPAVDPKPAVSPDPGPLRTALDRLLADRPIPAPAPIAPAEEDRLALAGYLPPLRGAAADAQPLGPDQQAMIAEAHHAAAILAGQRRFSAAIRALQAIVRDHPALAPVHYQIGSLLTRTGRPGEAVAAFHAAGELSPEADAVQVALTDALMHDGRIDDAQKQAEAAVTLAEKHDPQALAAAHEIAARVALARKDSEAALLHAEAVQSADAARPVLAFVRGRIAFDAGRYDDALAAFHEAAAAEDATAPIAELHLYLAETLSHLDRYGEAETAFRDELRNFPHSIQGYTSLAMLYRAMNRDDDVEDVLNELVEAAPTPEGYAVAARLWTILGERSRAEALRSDARARFPGDPSLVLLGRDGRR